ncbi:MAG: response regulator [Scytolyngbya sp. HA4215-MV1]|jgi:two-component system sensor histidine kinase/response regulator|nr:response regulator [Scytolyngbya sp. HA4215-MV1]
MLRAQTSTLQRILSQKTFQQLRRALAAFVQALSSNPLYLTEVMVQKDHLPPDSQEEQFSCIVSPQFQVLLLAKTLPGWQRQVTLTFDAATIAQFLKEVPAAAWRDVAIASQIVTHSPTIQPNDPILQSEFTLQLLEILDTESLPPPLLVESEFSPHPVCAPVEAALWQQVEQERLLYQVILQIRRSFELPEILETAICEVRRFLQSDRLVILQCEPVFPQLPSPLSSHSSKSASTSTFGGQITYESRSTDQVLSVLNLAEGASCLVDVPNYREKYSKGAVLAVSDVEETYHLSPCLITLLRSVQVRAKLIIPIIVQEELWGLLIAHQCWEPRIWKDNEKNFLQQVAEHLAIAIYQVKLYNQVQQQKQTLEQRVIERTQELHDALIAAQTASLAKSEFLSAMSHELRTPLTCVIGMSATLLRWSFGELSQKQRDYLAMIQSSGEHLLELINDILDLSQVEAGKTVLNISQFSLSQVAHQTLQTFKEKARLNQIALKLELQISPEQDLFTADSRRVKQILYNLLSNAIKFTSEGGQVTLRLMIENNIALIAVKDTGIGIAEQHLPLLFQKFQQLDTSYQRKYEGTGLGLALTKQLVELHGGWIGVQSKVGMGSTFTVRLPALPLPPPSAPAAETLHIQSKPLIQPAAVKKRIVVIEDHEDSATLICDLLTTAGYQVIWMIEGMTAVKQIEILLPALVITDIQLPGINGLEIINHLRQHPLTHSVKILALTAKALPEDQDECLQAGAHGYLAKPIQPEQLVDKVIELLN